MSLYCQWLVLYQQRGQDGRTVVLSFLWPKASLPFVNACPSAPAQIPEGQTAFDAQRQSIIGSEIVSLWIGCNKDLMGNSRAGRRGWNFQAERGRKQKTEIKSSDLEESSQTKAQQRKV